MKELPQKGTIGIFNRSYYEEALIVRVHPELLEREHLPPGHRGEKLWRHRFEDISNYEHYLIRNGTVILKFFLHVSKEEQRKRFLERLDQPDKHWKFSIHDLEERKSWEKYQRAYGEMLGQTSTVWAPWHIVPADHKWFTRLVVSETICRRLEDLHLSYPKLTGEQQRDLRRAKQLLSRS
jgi:polyphosphate kinase 2 (PPK2 family)